MCEHGCALGYPAHLSRLPSPDMSSHNHRPSPGLRELDQMSRERLLILQVEEMEEALRADYIDAFTQRGDRHWKTRMCQIRCDESSVYLLPVAK